MHADTDWRPITTHPPIRSVAAQISTLAAIHEAKFSDTLLSTAPRLWHMTPRRVTFSYGWPMRKLGAYRLVDISERRWQSKNTGVIPGIETPPKRPISETRDDDPHDQLQKRRIYLHLHP